MKIVIFGVGDIAKLACHYFRTDSNYEPIAFTVDSDFLKEETFEGLPVVSWEEIEGHYKPETVGLFIAVSYAKVNDLRRNRYLDALRRGYKCVSYVSSRATVLNGGEVAGAIGSNCFILENNTIQPFSKIGNNVTLWSGNHVGHDSVIQDHTFVASHVVISGNVTVGESCFLGVNSTLRNGITLGARTVLGAGALLMESTEEESVYTTPAAEKRKIKSANVRL